MNNRLLNWCFALTFLSMLLSGTVSAQYPCPLNVKDFTPIDGKDCVYFLELSDSASDGWDGASVDISVGEEWPATNYKVTVADGACVLYPIYVNDGETIDLGYWNGAFETQHGLTLYDALGQIATDETGTAVSYTSSIPANTPIRVKANCPLNSCKDETEDFTVRITMGDFPEEQSWEIYEGAASVNSQGNQVIGVNANTYNGLAPGFQVDYAVSLDLCNVYTFVAFDGFNDGWDSGAFDLITANLSYGTEITNTSDSHFGESLVLSGTGIADETRLEFTLPCAPICEDVLITNAVNCEVVNPMLPVAEAQVCYPDCGHAVGCNLSVEHIVLPFGVDYSALSNGTSVYTGTGSIMFSGNLPVGAHQLVTKYTYCDGIMVKCTTDLTITSQTNGSLTCNDNVIVSLGAPEWNDDDNQNGDFIDDLGECVVAITPDMVLEMPNICEEEYAVTVLDANGNPLVVYGANGLPLDANGFEIPAGSNTAPANNFVGSAELMQTLTYTVRHIASDNHCWGTISVEDKIAPVIVCNDYELNCTHPYALDENYSHEEEYAAAANELPANIAGGTGGLQSNTWIPVNVACGAKGEVVSSAHIHLAINHDDLADLQIWIHAPFSVNGGAYAAMLADNGDVEADNELYFSNSFIAGVACENLQGTSPEDFVTENSGANIPTNYGGTWYIQVIDNDVDFTTPYGGGEVTEAELHVECGFPFAYDAYDCSLEGVELINETLVETNCDQANWNGAQIERIWQAIDKYGNTSTSTQTVSLKAPTMDDIVKPSDVAIDCNGQSADELTLEETGIPTFGCFDLTEDLHGLCDMSYSFEDVVVPTCGEGYKVIRTWTLINWCSGVNKTHQQIIKVEDTDGPSIAQEDVTVGTNAYTCDANVSMSDLGIEDNCSGVSAVSASFTAGGGAYQGAGNLTIVDLTNGETLSGLTVGTTEVKITATDNCLNVTEKLITITVVDDTPPVAICDDELHVSLGGDGTARLYAEDVDEGSYDNCGDVTLEVRRTDGCLDETEWNSYVPFECCDVDTTITVMLRVTDAAGNTNVCWKSVLVEDALTPIITCPTDKTLDCSDPAIHTAFGDAEAIDNCNVEITYVDGGELDQCKAGTLTRTFTATDGSAKSQDATCVQTITVEHVSDFVVQFPADVTSTTCSLSDTGAPTISDDDCELVAISHEDRVFDIVPDACYKIERTWTIVNWCIYEAGNPANTNLGYPQPLPRTYQDDDGYFQYVQVIKVLDEDAPTLDNPGDLSFCDLTDGCEGQADLMVFPADECSDYFSLEYTYKIDAHNDGSFDIIQSGTNDASGVYPYGTHLIKWIVEDGCGNTAEMSHTFTISDCKKPTPVCLNGVSIPTMNSNGCAEIWASDLLEYAFDNCSDEEYVEASVKMRRAGSNDALTTGLTLCCEDVGTELVEIWVEDEAGNVDYCTTYIILQDNSNACGNGDLSKGTIAGTTMTQDGQGVEDVTIELEGANNTLEVQNTGTNGAFSFTNVELFADYTVGAEKDVDPLNGVSTFDLVLMSQHILGISPFTSPYTMIAADVNNDGNVTTFDVVQTRQLILYVITDFPANNSWRFVDADYVFPNPSNPWMDTFPEIIELNNLSKDELNTDFVAIKIADVDGNATTNSLLGAEERNENGTLIFAVDSKEFKANETLSVDFRASDFTSINGYQFTLNFDENVLNFASVEAGALNVTDANFGLTLLNEGVLTTSWNANTANTIKNDEVLFTVNFTTNATAELNEVLSINSRYTTAEAYNTTDLMDVAIAFNTTEGTVVNGGTFELYQNTPNPFNENTMISFNLPQASKATLTVFDVSGRTLKVISADFARGYNQINLDKAELNATGILYYELSTGTNSDTKKMIIID